LARQIDAGAPVDVFLAASPQWMDWLEQRGRIERGTRRVIARGALVLVAPKGRAFPFDPAGDTPLPQAFEGRLALADPEHVPLGAYAKQALDHAGWWTALASRVVGAGDARAALLLVESGECAAGIVYATDARGSERVDVVAPIPAAWHDEVVYPGALVAGRATPAARRFLDYLSTPPSLDVLRRHGFDAAPADTAR
jgi:molybdate transport system substrate-binding protein